MVGREQKIHSHQRAAGQRDGPSHQRQRYQYAAHGAGEVSEIGAEQWRSQAQGARADGAENADGVHHALMVATVAQCHHAQRSPGEAHGHHARHEPPGIRRRTAAGQGDGAQPGIDARHGQRVGGQPPQHGCQRQYQGHDPDRAQRADVRRYQRGGKAAAQQPDLFCQHGIALPAQRMDDIAPRAPDAWWRLRWGCHVRRLGHSEVGSRAYRPVRGVVLPAEHCCGC